MIDIANEVGLNAIQKNISAKEISNYFLPCIVFDKNETPFVLIQKKIKEATLWNPLENESFKVDISGLKAYKKAILFFRDKNKEELIDLPKNRDWFWDPISLFGKNTLRLEF